MVSGETCALQCPPSLFRPSTPPPPQKKSNFIAQSSSNRAKFRCQSPFSFFGTCRRHNKNKGPSAKMSNNTTSSNSGSDGSDGLPPHQHFPPVYPSVVAYAVYFTFFLAVFLSRRHFVTIKKHTEKNVCFDASLSLSRSFCPFSAGTYQEPWLATGRLLGHCLVHLHGAFIKHVSKPRNKFFFFAFLVFGHRSST